MDPKERMVHGNVKIIKVQPRLQLSFPIPEPFIERRIMQIDSFVSLGFVGDVELAGTIYVVQKFFEVGVNSNILVAVHKQQK